MITQTSIVVAVVHPSLVLKRKNVAPALDLGIPKMQNRAKIYRLVITRNIREKVVTRLKERPIEGWITCRLEFSVNKYILF